MGLISPIERNVVRPFIPKVDSTVIVDKLPQPEKDKDKKNIATDKLYLIMSSITNGHKQGFMYTGPETNTWIQVLDGPNASCDLSAYWIPDLSDLIYRHVKGAIILPVSQFYNINSSSLDCFVVSTKRCYNSDEVRSHCCSYLNYFEHFFDPEHTLVMTYYRLKYLIDYVPDYTEADFIRDLQMYILGPEIRGKAREMNSYNYSLSLVYRNNNNPGLQYNDMHGRIFMEISLLMNMCIPLLTHFVYTKKIIDVSMFLLKVFDQIFSLYDSVDVYNKIYETSISNVKKSKDENPILWDMQNIRGMNATTHSIVMVNNIILQIMPKYTYDKNIILFNYSSIMKNLGYQVVDISYEFAYVSLSSSKTDEDNNSEFDRFESRLIKKDEALYLQNKVNCEDTMRKIELIYGPFDPEEISFYRKRLTNDSGSIISNFQKDLIFNLFYQYFADPVSIKSINSTQYIELILAARKILEINGMVILPYIISGKVTKLITRKTVNKKELTKLESSPYYASIIDKYKNDKIIKYILSIIAIMLSSEFSIIDYYDKSLDGKKIDVIPEFIIEEVLLYVQLI